MEETPSHPNPCVPFRVHMLAFMGPGQIREVMVPKDIIQNGSTDLINRAVYNLGQNDRNPSRNHVSVSAGDVIEWIFPEGSSRYFMVELIGYHEITKDQFEGMTDEDSTPSERMAGRLKLVHGMDPLTGMPVEMKLSALLVLHHLLSNKKVAKSIVDDSVISAEMVAAIRKFVEGAMDDLRADAPDLSLA